MDGLKTGYTKDAMYCLTSTAKKNNMRLVSVVMGSSSPDLRSSDTVKMLNYGFNGYKSNIILKKDTIVGEIKVKKGVINKTSLKLMEDASELTKTDEKKKNYKYEIDKKELTAPLKKGDVIAKLNVIDEEGTIVATKDLTVVENIKKASILDYIKLNFKKALIGKNI